MVKKIIKEIKFVTLENVCLMQKKAVKKEQKDKKDKWHVEKIRKMVTINSTLTIIVLNINRLNNPIKRQRL